MEKSIFITGANRGIGLEFTRQFLMTGAIIYASCRTPERATALQGLQQQYPNSLHIIALDMLDREAIHNVSTLVPQPIDILILNAGISGQSGVKIGNLDIENLQHVFATNSFAPLCLADALLERVAKSKEKLIIAISSRMGSIGDNNSGGRYAYRGSKAALNALMFSLSIDIQADGIKVLILHPGSVQTDMGGVQALITAETSVNGMRKIIDNAATYASGSFLSYTGELIPW